MSNMEIKASINLSDFIERWSEDSFEQFIKDEIKAEVISAVKKSKEYKAIVARQTKEMMARLNLDV